MSEIQSVLFKKRYWTKPEAEKWLRKHDFGVYKVDETDKLYRYRQTDPSQYKQFRTIKMRPSILAVVGFDREQ